MGEPAGSAVEPRAGLEARTVPVREDGARSSALLLIGLASALFAVCATLGTAPLRVVGVAGVSDRFLVDVLLMAFALLWLVGLRALARYLSTAAGMRALAGVAFAGTVLCPLLLETDAWLVGVPLVAAGAVALVFLWWSHACTLGRPRLGLILAGAVSLAAALLVAAGLLPADSPRVDYLRDLAALASCLLLLAARNDLRDRLLRVSIAESRARRRDRRHSRLGELNYLSVGIILGADGGLWLLLGDAGALPADVSPVLVFGAALLVAGALVAASALVPAFDAEQLSKDYLSASLAVGYLLVPLLDGAALLVACGYLVALALVQVLIIFLAGAELVRFEELSPLYSFSEAAYLAGGVFVGALAMPLIGALAPAPSLPAACGAVLLYAVVIQVQLNKVSFPEEWVSEEPADAGVGAAEPAAGESPSAASDLPGSADDADARLIPAGSYLRRRLDDIGAHYGLSPRQCEILDLLARGRDTQYVMDRFTISRATAKTHVYNIYRKLDIHSRQDLYDLIEKDDFTTL